MNANVARSLGAAGMLLAAAAVGMIDGSGNSTAQGLALRCGFYQLNPPQGQQTAGYAHCANSFILIKFHWSQGSTGTACVEPWGQKPFFRHGSNRVVNAYYVTTPPNLSGPPGNQICSTGQPQV